jgi:hypothetical protein
MSGFLHCRFDSAGIDALGREAGAAEDW